MVANPLHLLEQGDVLGALGRAVLSGIPGLKSQEPLVVPGKEYRETVSPRSDALIDDYLRTVGGSPSSYRKTVPVHMYPQWSFPILNQAMGNLPYNMAGIMNLGFAVDIYGEVPRGEELNLTAQLVNSDVNDRRAIITMKTTTGTERTPLLLDITQTAIVKMPKKKKLRDQNARAQPRKEKPAIPANAQEIGQVKLAGDAGLNFSIVTGDINPLHWLTPYAQAFGQRGRILHGFASSAIALEILNKKFFSGRTDMLKSVEVSFTKPVNLPGKFSVFVDYKGGFYAGRVPGGDAWLAGSYTTKEER